MPKAVKKAPRTKTTPYDVAKHLRTPEEMAAYLDAWLDEAPDDAAGIAKALGDIARAKGMTQVAKDAGLSRESLYRALSADGNPSFATVLKVARALGVKLHAEACVMVKQRKSLGAQHGAAPLQDQHADSSGQAACYELHADARASEESPESPPQRPEAWSISRLTALPALRGGWTEASRGLGGELWRKVGGAAAIEAEREDWQAPARW